MKQRILMYVVYTHTHKQLTIQLYVRLRTEYAYVDIHTEKHMYIHTCVL